MTRIAPITPTHKRPAWHKKPDNDALPAEKLRNPVIPENFKVDAIV